MVELLFRCDLPQQATALSKGQTPNGNLSGRGLFERAWRPKPPGRSALNRAWTDARRFAGAEAVDSA